MTCVLPAIAEIFVGESGTVTGIIALEGKDALLVPIAFVATTVNVYDVPFVSPVTMIGDTLPVAVIPPGFDVTT